jgi:Cu/Ag efflux pump CusA
MTLLVHARATVATGGCKKPLTYTVERNEQTTKIASARIAQQCDRRSIILSVTEVPQTGKYGGYNDR